MDPINDSLTDAKIIDRLGGTSAVAALCQCRPPSVSEWKRDGVGIPAARRQFLQLLNPQAFDVSVSDDAVPPTVLPGIRNAA